ncbi:MAG: hypothetical protein ACR2H1_09145, partial [Limisphaerales bacterium]
ANSLSAILKSAWEKNNMKKISRLILLVIFLTGCATSTIPSRRQEKLSFYATLSPEDKELVDKGQIKIGIPSAAVYIAWGAPSKIMRGESDEGATTTWLYYGTHWQEYRFWNYRQVLVGRGQFFVEPYLDFQYEPSSYLRAEILFVNDQVKSWRTLGKTQ